ncbi:DsbA family protein [uncultured Rhodoblastus sp.]|uniref:DsbA family protein n=1 Tax=uncultured Rhodoblastus sp. TaxID=543037 RepID=UPI0025F2C140|nr:DsbA family protein [uncultured Rhodoblastus sp.]
MSAFRRGANRRNFLMFGGALALAGASFQALAQGAPKAAPAAKTPLDLLLAEPALPDVWLGDPKAPVTIIEYASMTCSHCADFNVRTFPALKAKYIDTGKVRFALREFPLDPLAAAGAMLARCSGDKREAMVELLFQQQKNWAFVNNPLEGLRDTIKQTGMGPAAFEACLNDQALFEKVNAVRDVAAQKFGINSTPTFFINGDKKPGEIPPEALDEVLAPYFK